MTFDEFVAKYNGQEVDTDGAYGGQCMDLMHQYIVDCLGYDLALFAAPTAYEAFKNANDSRFDKILNTPDGVPQKGDIIFWNTGIGSAGHVAIFIEGDTNRFTSFDQNWPTGSFCHVQEHTYKSVAGWLHPKEVKSTVAVEADKFQELVDKSTKYDNFKAAGYASVEDILKEKEVLNNEKNDIQNQLTQEISKNQDLRAVLDKQTKADADLGAQLLEAQHKVSELEQAEKKPVEEVVKPVQDYALGLQNALDGLIYKKAPKKSQNILIKLINKLFFWYR